MNGRLLQGIVPPLGTPLADRDALDVAGLERMIEHVIGGGVHALFMLGTTGEAMSLSGRLRREVITRSVRQVDRRVPVAVGVSDTSLAETIELARFAAESGADAIVVGVPCYVPPTQGELIAYVRTIVGEQPLPVLLYNIPVLTKVGFEVETVVRLAEEERILGIKDSGGDLEYIQRIIARVARGGWSVLVGAQRLFVDAMRTGAHGGVCGGANLYPRAFVELYDAARGDDLRRVERLSPVLERLDGIYRIGPPGVASVIRGMKAALACRGICSGRMAAPFEGYDAAQREEVERRLGEIDAMLSGAPPDAARERAG